MFASAINDIASVPLRARALFALTVALASCALASCGNGCGHAPPPSRPAPPEVSVLTLRAAPVTVYDEYVARVAAPDTIEIRSQVTGILARVVFTEGGSVREGELLYVIEEAPFRAAVHQAEGDLAQAKAQAANARANEARYRELLRRRVVSAQEYDSYRAAAESLSAQVASREAALRDAQINLSYCEIRAPQQGSVSRSLVRPGSLVTAQQTLLTTLYAGDLLYVYFAVDQDDVRYLTQPSRAPEAVGKQGEPSGETSLDQTYQIVLGDGTTLPMRGHLDFLAPSIEVTTGTMQARLAVPVTGGLLPGQYVRVRVPILERSDGIRVPQRAVSELQGLKSVFVVEDGKVRSQRIEAAHRVGNDWLVDRGLSAGETIVIEGTGKVQDGQAVRTVPYTPPTEPESE